HAQEISSLTLSCFSYPETMCTHPVLTSCARLRHDAFCMKHQWEPVVEDGLEVDQYDPNSHHVVLAANFSGESRQAETVLAYLRLVDGTKYSFESETHIVPMLATQAEIPSDIRKKIEQGRSLEISRFCINTRRVNKITTKCGMDIKPSDLNLLMACKLCHKILPEVESFVAILEPWLCRQIKKQGLNIKQIGEPINHRGIRFPVEIDMHDQQNRYLVNYLDTIFNTVLAGKMKTQTYGYAATWPVHHVGLLDS
ncbi:MAG: GNAT family N-acetyltransferase, partial [Alphaproteobacteria bacterium]|nr:GNAT family N-acetyltransferase [Alphaproteobacteria bacterium]